MNKELPIYKIVLPDDIDEAGINLISLVDNPAIEVKGFAFEKKIEPKKYFFNDDKQIIAAPALIPDFPIYRNDENGEYNVVFTKEEIQKLVNHFNKNPKKRPINIDHSNKIVDAYIKANWIIEDEQFDKSRMYGFELPVGTWFMEIQIEDSELWNTEVKQNEKFGLSIEGLLGLSLSKAKIEANTKNDIKMNKKTFKFSTYELKDGGSIIIDGEVAVDSAVYTVTEDGTQTLVEAETTFVLADGKEIAVNAEGLITEVKESEQPEAEAEAEVETELEDAPVEEVKEEAPVVLEEAPSIDNTIDNSAQLAELRNILSEIMNRVELLEANSSAQTEKEVETELNSDKKDVDVKLAKIEFLKNLGFKSK